MPSTKEKYFPIQRDSLDLYGAGGEPPGEPPAPPSRSGRTPRGLSAELVEDALGQARLRTAVGQLDDEQRARLVDGLVDELAGDRDGLPEELNERLLDGM